MTKREADRPELLVLHECGDVWKELRQSLPEGLRSGELEFVSPSLVPYGWVLSLVGMPASIRRVGTLGAVWAEFEPEERVQLWIPGALEIPEGVIVQVSFSEAA